MNAAERRVVLAGVVGTTASVYPAFLTGAVSVQLRQDLGLTERDIGIAIGCFFASAALGSALLGSIAERLGGVRAMKVGLSMTLVSAGLLALLARSAPVFWALLLIAGASNALTQPSANLLLAGGMHPDRLGSALAVKQSGMPLATMLGGLAVPAIALTVGWEAAFAAGAVLAAVAWTALLALDPNAERAPRPPGGAASRGRVPDLPMATLAMYALVGGLAAAGAGSMVSFLVSGAEAAGMAPGPSGLLLTAGSIVGITSRLQHGRLADQGRVVPLTRVALLLAIGGGGLLLLALDQPLMYAIGIVPAFGAGWAWPGLFNLSVIRTNPTAPAAATGVSQTGVYLGAGTGPALGGVIVEQFGYGALWLGGGAALLFAAVVAAKLHRMSGAHNV